ncbi:MAG: DNA phosphorothioation system sulfurtransferase DndC [Nitrosopumilus sp.]|nr:DNA phosphorothioation system sulfurtransferase DndC [Nitrosopumilus sp.]NRA06466.1 DNA phosphorothioation system sulfurtransferase DndC [Nitrosopumilus sp.]
MTAESVFKSRTLKEIYDEIREVYLSDNRPWILGFSGGKDSTCMVQLIWHAISDLPKEKRQKKIYIISSDTLVESPKIVEQLTNTLDIMESSAQKQGLEISTNLVRPEIKDSFWVCLLGLGYPAPSNNFRWCTDRLKIRNADRFITNKVSEYGEAIVVLGTRKDESGSRSQLMNLYEIEGSHLSRHSKFAQTYVYTPLRDFITEDVWNYLLQNKNPWGGNNRDLLALYQNADAAECPLVVDTSTPSCGNSRFGCWVCTVVERDKSMENLIDSGEDWMEPLLELRQELKDTQDPEKKLEIRDYKRRDGHVTFHSDGTEKITPGPYKIEFRKQFLRKLLLAQNSIRKNGPDPKMSLILEEELHEIQRIWRMEQGDWKNSVYQIYEEVTSELISPIQEDLGGFSNVEQDILDEVCKSNDVPKLLVSRLLHAEFDSQGMTRHSKIYPKIGKILSEEWRGEERLDEITKEIKEKRDEKREYT